MKRLLFQIAAAVLLGAPAFAQAPSITGVFPPGGPAGATLDVSLAGTNLADVKAVLVSGSGVKVEPQMGGSVTALPLRVTVEPNAEVGLRELRVITARGASNAGRIWVGAAGYPEGVEKEPNDARATPQTFEKYPVTVSGRSDKAEDVDHYAFTAGAGETWVFTVNAARHHSQLDAYLALLDERGRLLRSALDNFDRDPHLVYTFKNGGKYLLQVRDTLFRGGPGFTYRVSMGKRPLVTRWSPMGGAPGSTVTLALQGVNLAGTQTVQVALPNDPDRDMVLIAPRTPAGPANPIPLFVGKMPETLEKEPNNDAATASRLASLPALVGGHIEKDGDRDFYAFTAAEKQAVVIEVLARRLGSRMDPVLRVLDSAGKQLAQNDDAAGKDPRLTFTAPAAGTYLVEVRPLTGRGGDDFYYRLRLAEPPPPDFRLTMTPDNPTVPAGGSTAVTITAQRAGYAGEIPLRLEGLPAGVTASPSVIRAGQNSVVFTLTSAPGSQPAGSMLKVVGTAKIGDREVQRTAVGQESYQPPLATPQQARMRETEIVVSAVGPAPPYTLAVTAAAGEVQAGQKLELTIKAVRTTNYKENIAVTVAGLPANVKASALTINGDKAEGKITLEAAGNAAVGLASLVVQGNAKNVIVAAPALSLEVKPAPPKK